MFGFLSIKVVTDIHKSPLSLPIFDYPENIEKLEHDYPENIKKLKQPSNLMKQTKKSIKSR